MTTTSPSDTEPVAPAAVDLVVGAYLRALRRGQRQALREAAPTIRGSAAKLSRIETGAGGFTGARAMRRANDVTALLGRYGILDAPTILAVREMVQAPRRHMHFDGAPGWLDRFRACLHQATAMSVYSSHEVPEILQVAAYPADWVSDFQRAREQSRIAAPSLVADISPRFTALLDEIVLQRAVGDPAVMAQQMEYLQHLGSSGGPWRIFVVPLKSAQQVPISILYRLTLNRQHEMFVEERPNAAVYYTGAESTLQRRLLNSALSLAMPADQSADRLDEARAAFAWMPAASSHSTVRPAV